MPLTVPHWVSGYTDHLHDSCWDIARNFSHRHDFSGAPRIVADHRNAAGVGLATRLDGLVVDCWHRHGHRPRGVVSLGGTHRKETQGAPGPQGLHPLCCDRCHRRCVYHPGCRTFHWFRGGAFRWRKRTTSRAFRCIQLIMGSPESAGTWDCGGVRMRSTRLIGVGDRSNHPLRHPLDPPLFASFSSSFNPIRGIRFADGV